ncbi:LamG-like jellyroll fold domain-containing protein [Treponema pedis]|uniref:Fibronectin type-III domain-containing protein n=1 Tax=Treponema pedis TaxID=409322 RepID=A0A7S6WPM4_9SPIR|nr:LamG-like jellyroll fold domain-containing protein [Treponema pedis]QOW60998.1 hypothetical protein IFE08_00825 [Treponema pedis]
MYKFKLALKRKILFILGFFCFSSFSVFNEEAALEFGGKSGWNNLLSSSNIKIRKGKFGYDSVGLTSSVSKTSSKTDMYISFDFDEPVEETGSYSLTEHSVIRTDSDKAKFGEGAGLCSPHSKTGGVKLMPMPDSFFAGNTILKSFTIEFWLYPQAAESGSKILKWWASLMDKKKTMYQNIIASILNNKLEWEFFNIWQDKNNKGIDVRLLGKSNIIPETWSHHLITYNDETGLLEYRMNGRTEDIIYLTSTGREGSQVMYSMLGTPSDVVIALNYSGLIDELKVVKQFTEPAMSWEVASLFEKYPLEGGRIETNIIDSGGKKSVAKMLKASFDNPAQTDVEFFIRSADSPFNWTENYPEWKTVKFNEAVKDITGRFFQIACDIYPDSNGTKSPLIHSIVFQYEKDGEPLPPAKVFAKALDGAVELIWAPSVDFDTKGYLIYFGEKKGEYQYPGSPIDAGNVTKYKIENLKNGKNYFFAIAAYDEENGAHSGATSKEVYARPLQSKKE